MSGSEYIDYTVVYAAMERSGRKIGARIANYSDALWCEARGYVVRFDDARPDGTRPGHKNNDAARGAEESKMTIRAETLKTIAAGITNGAPYRVMDLAADLDLTTEEVHRRVDGCLDRGEVILRGVPGVGMEIHDEDTLDLTTLGRSVLPQQAPATLRGAE